MAERGKCLGFRPGVLNKNQLKELSMRDVIENIKLKSIDQSSFDIHIGNRYWEMKGSVKPQGDRDIEEITKYSKTAIKNLEEGQKITLESNISYIFECREQINFQGTGFFAKATGRSTIGRVDVLTRLIAKGHDAYDEISNGEYVGRLYLEVTPITFPIKIWPDIPISQLRVFAGEPEMSEITDKELEYYLYDHILDANRKSISEAKKLSKLTLNLEPVEIGGEKTVAFRALEKEYIEKQKPLDLTKNFNRKRSRYDPSKYWKREQVKIENAEKYIVIEPEVFYILRSKERFSLPPDVAVYCRAVTEELGEIRIHYAGFVHPYFGADNKDEYDKKKGAPLIFEVRGHNVRTVLRDGETLANLKYYKMSKEYEKDSRDYGKQELKLSKVFKDWPE